MKTIVRVCLIALFILIAGFFTANFFISQKIQNLLDQEPAISCDSFSINSFKGSLSLKKFELSEPGRSLKIEKVDLNVSIVHYLLNKEILVELIDAEDIDLKMNTSSQGNNERKKDLELDIATIEEVDLKDFNIQVLNQDKLLFTVNNIEVKASDVNWPLNGEHEWLDNESLQIKAEDLMYDVNDLHTISSGRFSYIHSVAEFTKFKMKPKYSKSEYIQYIEVEKDLIDLEAKSFSIFKPEFAKMDSTFQLGAKKIHIDSLKSNIYRDKTVTDDSSIKPLYSESLRNLDFKVKIDSILISESELKYQELMKKNHQPGEIEFNSIDGHITNFHNMLGHDKPKIKAVIEAQFTEQSDIHFELNFVPDHENFHLRTKIQNTEDQSVNGFFAPAISMKLEGTIDIIATNFSGDDSELNGDFRMAYQKLKLDVLRKDGSKNNFASLLSNVFVNNRNVNKTFRLERVKRDQTKSFWNYVWTFHLKGLKRSLL